MLRRSLLAAQITFLIGAFAASAALAAPAVTGAWSRPAVAGGVGGGFMTLTNPGRTADALIAIESPKASRVEMHSSSMANGVASMRKLERLDVPAGGSASFAPGGNHLMFFGLKTPLNVGDTLPATLTFASGARVNVGFKVTLAPPSDMSAHHH